MWKPINNYEGLYEVDDLGHVRSIRRSGSKGLSIKFHLTKGYWQCWLSKNNKVKRFAVHRLVAEAFIPNPENKPQVNHKDGNKMNSRANNLEWVTRAENEKHKREVLGFDSRGERNGNYGYRSAKLYPNEELRSRLVELGVPRYKHNLAELGEVLPEKVEHHTGTYFFLTTWKRASGEYAVKYKPNKGRCFLPVKVADTEANARAKMLIFLLENKLI